MEKVTLRRSTGFLRWETPGVIDGSSAERAVFVRAEDVADALRETAVRLDRENNLPRPALRAFDHLIERLEGEA